MRAGRTGRLAQPLAAVGQVHAHGGLGGIGVAALDGVVDVLVLDADAFQVLHALGGADLQAAARNHHGAQVAHDVGEIAVAGGARDGQVEGEVAFHRVIAGAGAVPELVQRLAHRRQLRLGAARGRQAGRFGLHADAEFQHRHHVHGRSQRVRPDPERRWRLGRAFQHEGADAVAGLHQAAGLQPRQRFAHHGAAHAHGRHDLGFGRQLVAGLELALADLLAEGLYDFLGKRAAAAAQRSGAGGARSWGERLGVRHGAASRWLRIRAGFPGLDRPEIASLYWVISHTMTDNIRNTVARVEDRPPAAMPETVLR
ncbi:hypothetical protein CBM2634_B20112 [Cupriavidus taiwanensis]|uniref:Uncharacterized protein n=1 Tax=Cupriavidus taiwanensis TaxID=164546 RepID=A0A375JCW1_9BURK|nr:hypothetical protein CBM2634_B20112 [Cupriavidus taiwanensis]